MKEMRITNYTRVKKETIEKAIENNWCDSGKYRYFSEQYSTFLEITRTKKEALGTTAALEKELVAIVHIK